MGDLGAAMLDPGGGLAARDELKTQFMTREGTDDDDDDNDDECNDDDATCTTSPGLNCDWSPGKTTECAGRPGNPHTPRRDSGQ